MITAARGGKDSSISEGITASEGQRRRGSTRAGSGSRHSKSLGARQVLRISDSIKVTVDKAKTKKLFRPATENELNHLEGCYKKLSETKYVHVKNEDVCLEWNQEPTPPYALRVRQKVQAKWEGNGVCWPKWYRAEIISIVEPENKFKIRYDIDDEVEILGRDNIQDLTSDFTNTWVFCKYLVKVGDRVEASKQNHLINDRYDGKITKSDRGGFYTVRFKDGWVKTLPLSKIRTDLCSAPTTASKYMPFYKHQGDKKAQLPSGSLAWLDPSQCLFAQLTITEA